MEDVKQIVEKIKMSKGYVLLKYIDLPEKYNDIIFMPVKDKKYLGRTIRSWKGKVIKISDDDRKKVGFREGDYVFFDEKMGIRYYDGDDMYMISKVDDIFAVFEDCSEDEVKRVMIDVYSIK